MKVISREVFDAIGQHAFYINFFLFFALSFRNKLTFYEILKKTKKKRAIYKKILRLFCNLQKTLLRELLDHVKKVIYIHLL